MDAVRPQFTIRTLMLVTMAVAFVLMFWRTAASIVPTLDQHTLDVWLAFVGFTSIVLIVAFAGWWAISR